MSTGILNKTTVKATWDTARLQEASTRALVNNCLAATKVCQKYGKEAQKEFQEILAGFRANYFKSLNVKNPLELIKAMAEFETNVFGSVIAIWGEENKASLQYESCGCWNTMQKSGLITPELERTMGESFQTSIECLAKEFGFKGELAMGEHTATITFSK